MKKGPKAKPKDQFAEVVPEEVEVVVNYDIRLTASFDRVYFEANGVALIPKIKR